MKITIAAVGRLKRGPERELTERLIKRATMAGRKTGLSFEVREIAESRAGAARVRRDQEAAALLAMVPDKAVLVALDENGATMDSRAFAAKIGQWRDKGSAELVFAIGGADGHGDALLEHSDLKLAFGAMTWPHQLVRLMLAEQLYRSITILLGHPYHRG
jgi:23S rRNA (pseudouridine1915-N3)-methyltransferase